MKESMVFFIYDFFLEHEIIILERTFSKISMII